MALLAMTLVLSACSAAERDPLDDCVQGIENLKTHTHAELTLAQDGRPMALPGEIGLTAQCMRPLHTHEDDGVIHTEHPQAGISFTLGEFFQVWEEGLGRDPLEGRRVALAMVNGVPRQGDYHDIQLTNGLRIHLELQTR